MDSDNFDWLRFVVFYTASRLGLLLMLVIFGAFSGAVLFPSIATFLPYTLVDIKTLITDSVFDSAVGTVVVCMFLIWIFFDDAKRHTAYEELYDHTRSACDGGHVLLYSRDISGFFQR